MTAVGWIISGSGVEKTQFTQGGVIPAVFGGAPAENNVIEHLDFQKLAGADEIAGGADVRLGRGWVAAGMVVDQDQGGGVGGDGGSKNFARMDQERIEKAMRNELHANELAPRVEEHG